MFHPTTTTKYTIKKSEKHKQVLIKIRSQTEIQEPPDDYIKVIPSESIIPS
jgi:hypothetical protein